ncbi:MAG: MBL fold metallo-hydrolase [Planctomycetota bacterium]|jgi:glyoxylase-like metal-dependent hydrolase (beta-lactamase superfamily II)|nr:MBL fold metallo-hydrolase [Planctomycetota bacterium]
MKTLLASGLLLAAMATGAVADEMVYAYKVGTMEVFTLVETRSTGGTGILVNAGDAIKRYLPDGKFPLEINAFLVKNGGKNILIDTGFGGAIIDEMRGVGVAPEQVNTVLITHTHGDHVGGLSTDGVARFPNAELFLSQPEQVWGNGNAATVAALAPYAGRWRTFKPAAFFDAAVPVADGITAIAAFGHTPGHTVYLLESNGEKLLIWGDLLHVQAIQFPAPEVSVTYDSDPVAAAATRRQILEYVAREKIPVAGMHLHYPAIGMVEKSGDGFRWQAK